MRTWLILATLAGGSVCVLDAVAGEPGRTIDVSRVLDASPPTNHATDISITPTPPDPPPLIERTQWVFDLRWHRGDVWLLGIREFRPTAPQATPRVFGRFALELFEGGTIIERVRFDFPLLGGFESDAGVSFAKKLGTRIGVIFPATARGTRLELCDRATNRRWALPWPPPSAMGGLDAGTLPAVPAEAGAEPRIAPRAMSGE